MAFFFLWLVCWLLSIVSLWGMQTAISSQRPMPVKTLLFSLNLAAFLFCFVVGMLSFSEVIKSI